MNHSLRALTLADYEAVLRLWRKTEGIGLNESDQPRERRSFSGAQSGFEPGCCLWR